MQVRKMERKKKVLEEWVDAVVVGAGHAGCEAALACGGRPVGRDGKGD